MYMDYIKELGPLAIASRLRRLSDQLMLDVLNIYKEAGIDFETRWFPVTHYLSVQGPTPLTKIARALKQSHPSIVQIARSMEKHGMVVRLRDKADDRINKVGLSKKGELLVESLSDIWDDIDDAAKELLKVTDGDFLSQIAKIEQALDKEDIYYRVKKRYIQRKIGDLVISNDYDQYGKDFLELNTEWLINTVGMSDYDKKVLDNPKKEILSKGGEIYIALVGQEVIGTFTVMPLKEGSCELSKFVVKKQVRKMGLGSKMVDKAFEIIKNKGFKSILLLTHPDLQEAIDLYEKKGFIHIDPSPLLPDYSGRCSVYMKKELES